MGVATSETLNEDFASVFKLTTCEQKTAPLHRLTCLSVCERYFSSSATLFHISPPFRVTDVYIFLNSPRWVLNKGTLKQITVDT